MECCTPKPLIPVKIFRVGVLHAEVLQELLLPFGKSEVRGLELLKIVVGLGFRMWGMLMHLVLFGYWVCVCWSTSNILLSTRALNLGLKEGPPATKASIPLYTTPTTPQANRHIGVTQSNPQCQSKLEAPIRVLITCLNEHPNTAAKNLVILWKTLSR